MLLLVSAISAFATGWLGYRSGRDNLTERIQAQLESLRESTAEQLKLFIDSRRAHVRTLGEDRMFIEATGRFDAAAGSIADGARLEPQRRALEAYYRANLSVDEEGGGKPVIDAYLPQSPSGTYLQYQYVVASPEPAGKRSAVADAGDGSRYSRTHAAYHGTLADVARAFDYRDLLLIDPDGNVVYSVEKEIDFGTNLLDGPFSDSGLARAFRAARAARASGFVHVEDHSFYVPSDNRPNMFMASPMYQGGELAGVVAVQLSSAPLDRIVNNGGDWEVAGLGESGKMFVIGGDRRMRTTVRPFIQDPDLWLSQIREQGTDARTIERIREEGSTILLQTAESETVLDALRGLVTVQEIAENYRGVPALAASMPLGIEGLDWALVVEMPTEEAYAPVREFGRSVLIVSTLLSILLTLLAMALSRLLTRPIRQITERVRRVSAGELDAPIRLARGDEFGELSEAVQEEVDTLRARIKEARAETSHANGLIDRLLPDGMARRLRARGAEAEDGEALHAPEPIEEVALVFARLSGYEALLAELGPVEGVRALDALVQTLDALAERSGVEKVRTVGDTYLAASGLSATHLDNDQRALGFAVEFRERIRAFAAESGHPVEVAIGVASGPVVSAVIGRTKLAFDLFGPTAIEVEALCRSAAPGAIRVSEATAARLGAGPEFAAPGSGAPGRELVDVGAESVRSAA